MTLCSVARLARSETSPRLAIRTAARATARIATRAVTGTASPPAPRGHVPRACVEPLPHDIACAALVDPHDETLEIEITEDMVNLALEAVDGEQVWPYAADPGLVARPYHRARIIRFPGC